MFVGHLAVALGAKKVEPTIPLGAAVARSGQTNDGRWRLTGPSDPATVIGQPQRGK